MSNHKGTIIIADDDGGIRSLIGEFLEATYPEYKIEFCTNGDELQNRLEKAVQDVALVITDNNMEKGPTGGSLIKQYATRQGFPPMLLIYGANDNNEIGKDAMRNGAVGYLKKPVVDLRHIELVVDGALSPDRERVSLSSP
jgi:DNA-binding NtrC family response regulator